MNSPRLRHMLGAKISPGERLGNTLLSRDKTTLIAGKGTYVRQGQLVASLLGTLCAHHQADGDEERWIISIEPEQKKQRSQSSYVKNSSNICPQVGDVVLGRVTRVVRPSHAMVDIIAIVPEQTTTSNNNTPFIQPLHEPYSGTLRQNEIRPNSSLEIEISECIRPSDVILARVHASGEKDYILTTAEAELGVIQAVCESSGREMVPVSWKEMECNVTGVKEGRKVAKPRQVVKSG
ncbi:predicted protein [Thalassiosira pseudonana CCMP1335]|uniref:Exosome complex component N-terminal domain-containing protein n=1 Tax=Thalassiosira pseudonana TaxID=35128 RepID=B5YLU8_THAPS|nr:predicted protein [Thalassiosira pseudonana CCMP1335]ACI64139.1 predicted protein [Thalassiosira pseudonana CCMP1335]|eukprot:scaffold1508_cov186-Alexandrium_tamarense.AAC.15